MKIPPLPLVCFLVVVTPPLILGLRCELDCGDDVCVETIARVPKKACRHLARPSRWPSNTDSKKHLTVDQKKRFLEITLSRDREPGSTLLLTLHGQGGRQCLNITAPENQTYTIGDGWAKTRLKCWGVRLTRRGLQIKLYDLTNRKRLDSHRLEKRPKNRVTEAPLAAQADNESRHPRTICSCTIPEVVYLKPECVSDENYTMTVSWKPLYNRSDLRVGIVPEGNSDEFVANGFQKLPIWKLITQRLQNVTFTNLNLNSGSNYMGLVGSLGCDSCMRYKESETLRLRCSTEAQVSPEPPPALGVQGTSTTSGPPIIVNAVIGVGAFAFIGVLALGVFLLKVLCGKKYGPLPASDRSASLETVAHVSVVRSLDEHEVVRGAEDLVFQLEQRGKTTVSSLVTNVREVSISASDLIFYVKNRTDRYEPPCLKQLTSKTVTVLLQGEGEPHVVVPRDFCFGDLLNNQMAPGRNIALEDFLNKLGPAHLDVGPSEVRALMLSCDSGDDTSQHRKATEELVKLMRDHLKMNVVDIQELTHLQELRNSGPTVWAREKVEASNLVIIVPSNNFTWCHTEDVNVNNVQRITQDALVCLKQRSSSGQRVCVVTFGYWTEYAESVQEHVPVSHTFHLVESNNGDPTRVRHNLLPFFSWICPDTELVERACRAGDEFLINADRMSDKVCGRSTVMV